MRGEVFAEFRPGKMDGGIALLQLIELWTAADYSLGSGQIELEKGLDVLLDRNAPDVEKDGARQMKTAGRVWLELRKIDAAGPKMKIFEAMRHKFIAQGARRNHDARPGIVKPALKPVTPGDGNREPSGNIFGKTRVITRRETAFGAQAISAHGQANRT